MFNKDLDTLKKKIELSKVLIFDFDGVIADSNEVKTQAFAELYESFGEEIVVKVVDHHKKNRGMSRFEKFKYYHSIFLNQDLNKATLNKLSNRFSELVFNKVVSSNEINSAGSFLEKYCSVDRVCVINSATPQSEIEEIIRARGLAKVFSSIFGSPSSKLENITKILNKYSCSKDEVVFFGDSEADLIAANSAEIYFIGIGSEIMKYIRIKGLNYPSMKNFKQILDN